MNDDLWLNGLKVFRNHEIIILLNMNIENIEGFLLEYKKTKFLSFMGEVV